MIKLDFKLASSRDTLYCLDTKNGREFLPDFDDYDKGSSDGRLLAHDALEHFSGETDENLNELEALGIILAHREQDFYNRMGDYSFPDEVARQLYAYAQNNQINRTKCTSNNQFINKHVNKYWQKIKKSIATEFTHSYGDDDDIDYITPEMWRILKHNLKRHLAKGYNHFYRIGYYDFSSTFDKLKRRLDEILKSNRFLYSGSFTVYVNFKQQYVSKPREPKHNYD